MKICDDAKRRLITSVEISTAVRFLWAKGFHDDQIPVVLSSFYYVDLDVLNDVMLEATSFDREPVRYEPIYEAA